MGPYAIVAPLARGPGAELVEARDAEGRPFLLQLAVLKKASSDAEREARHEIERAVARATAKLIDEPEIEVHAHGGAEGEDGARVLFWALTWPEHHRPFRADTTPDAGEVLQIGLALARRLVRRHGKGRAEPLLAAPFLLIRGAAEDAEIAGAPVFVDPEWLEGDASLLAPEELEARKPGPSGDVFRLGKALAAIAANGPPLPPAIAEAISAMLEPDPAARTPDAHAAVERLVAAKRALDDGHDATFPEGETPAPHGKVQVTEPVMRPVKVNGVGKEGEPLEIWRVASPDVSTREETAHPSAPPPPSITEAPTGPTPAAALDAPTPAPARASTPLMASLPAIAASMSAMDTVVDAPGLVLPRTVEEPLPPGLASTEVVVIRTVEPDPPRIDPDAAAWSTPILPVGESPWSEVVSARGAQPAAHHPKFEGFEGDISELARELSVPSRTTLPPGEKYDPIDIDAELRAALPSVSAGRFALGAVVLLAMAGLIAFLVRSNPRPIVALDTLLALPTNQVILEAYPESAVVIGEADGRVLGKTPLTILVPPNANAVVLIAADGYDPQRMVLPERGQVKASLARLPINGCEVKLIAPDDAELEGVGVEIGRGPSRFIPGAAIVRARDGQDVAGARIVRCPSIGGGDVQHLELPPVWSPALVRVTTPAGGNAYLNGDPLGRLPGEKHVSRSFSLIRVDDARGRTVERWIPSTSDIEVQMPVPSEPTPATAAALPPPEPPRKAERLTPDAKKARARDLYQAGTKSLIAGKVPQAKESLLACIDLDAGAADCHRAVGTLYLRSKEKKEARAHLERYLELAPKAPDADGIRRILESER